MGLFDKKFCDICGGKIGLLGNRKLEDGNMCKDCASLLSPFTTDRRKTSLSEIKDHLAYRDDNKTQVEMFNATRSLGGKTKVLLDEDAAKFIVTSSSHWQNENPDVVNFSQVIGCQTDIRESRTEIKFKNKDGTDTSFVPPRYDIDYDFYITIQVNSPWFNEMSFKINNNSISQSNAVEYRETERIANEIREALTEVRESASTSRKVQTCPMCGATTTPDVRGCCEFCGGVLPK